MISHSFPRRVFALWALRMALLYPLLGLCGAFLHNLLPPTGFAAEQIFSTAWPAGVFYLFLRSRSRMYAVKGGRLYYNRGVLFRRSTVIELKNVMLFARIETPLARLFRLNGAALWGGRMLVYIDGLSRSQLINLRTASEQQA